MLNDQELHAEAQRLMMSPTMQSLAAMAADCPINMRDMDSVKSALATSSNQMIRALDNDRIQFKDVEDKAMFFGLLMTALEIVMDGRLKDNVHRSSMQ